ncbi:MAG: RluA family pseudouridine synthase [Erysipelotrichaceae bacterium]|jgi:23S rRNA pseudouridine1911/1915/1917 synthase|nr:RluA family pseudouridine synthase [Erysipelotrichaceae bacterium]
MAEFVIQASDAGVRLDKWLAANIEELSRSRIQQLIDHSHVLVNGETVRSNYTIKENDLISLTVPPRKLLQVKAQPMDLDIIYEDRDIIVVNKPRGLVVHPGSGHQEDTLVSGLLAHCEDLSGINGILRPGIVHRIDKDTTGLLVAAKNDKAHHILANQLRKHEVSREYLALVKGRIDSEKGRIEAPIGRSLSDRKKMAVHDHASKEAITHFTVEERFADYTLVRCVLETGRTHQIRVHMNFISHPVAGDKTYGGQCSFALPGQLLHAQVLTLTHPRTKEVMRFEAPLPADFMAVLSDLRKAGTL